jgi:hypothetical protein
LATGIPARLTAAEGRKFALTVGTAFVVLAGISLWRNHPVPAGILGALGIGLIAAGAVIPARLGPVYRAWMGLALAISRVTTPIFMGVVFFAVLMPMGLLMRLFGRNPLTRKPINESYWVVPNEMRGSLKNQF